MKYDFLAKHISGIKNNTRYGKCDSNGVSMWVSEADYNTYTNSQYDRDEITFDFKGKTYREHMFFVNEEHASSVVGYSLINDEQDVVYCVVGCRTDFVCDFDTMYEYLINPIYFM
jgi:hypothetical protein